MSKILTMTVLAALPILASAGAVPNECYVDCPPVAVPEPGALSLMLMGLAVVGAIKLRNRFRK